MSEQWGREKGAEELFWSLLDKRGPDECWLWLGGRMPKGYGKFRFKGRHYIASRFALTLKLGRPINDGMLACHKCDNPPCANPSHLFEGSPKDNMEDAVRKGRTCKWSGERRGEQNPRAKVNAEIVREIRTLSLNTRRKELAERFGLSKSALRLIIIGETWSHVG